MAESPEIISDSFLSCIPKNVALAVSTYTSGHVYLISPDRQHGHISLALQLELPSGITACGDTISVASIDRIDTFTQAHLSTLLSTNINTDLFSDQNTLRLVRSAHTGKVLCHEIYAVTNNEMFFINTRYSAISVVRGDDIEQAFWAPPFITHWIDEDLCHLNGLGILNNKPSVTTCLAGSNFSRGWRIYPYSAGLLIDVQQNEIISRGLMLPHSPRCVGNNVYFLESGFSALSVVDRRTGIVERLLELPGFARGLAISAHYAFIGLSVIRKSNLWNDLPVKKKHPSQRSGIIIVNLVTCTIEAEHYFGESVEEVFDVQLITSGHH
ncbi:MAG: DUF4915 domain-containing protein [Cyanobacteriota bacterium]|jgi:uncharacterized protein (TIGR03032 family)